MKRAKQSKHINTHTGFHQQNLLQKSRIIKGAQNIDNPDDDYGSSRAEERRLISMRSASAVLEVL